MTVVITRIVKFLKIAGVSSRKWYF